ncbi:PAS domain-containing sensor histidine kinase [Photobacterium atrarenae]|uniref:histidine kinase n=1 Tax=Photobacterium atrarenae TaxID=865757 RepID=A0ABY5GKW6_9GAMM|nr:ATP-binding protein [Photobacterium atrarenae]UTV29380.1 PAS domain S-box protein [Photobacterium atrarenae]
MAGEQGRLYLDLWLRLLQQGAAAEQAAALCRYAESWPGVSQAYWLSWQPQEQIYAHDGGGPALPPGQGDPLKASDAALFEQLNRDTCLSLAEVRQEQMWLSGRLRRAGLAQGTLIALTPVTPGVLVVATSTEQQADALPAMATLLQTLLINRPKQAPEVVLLQRDPLPGLRFNHFGVPLAMNAAMQQLLAHQPESGLSEMLPVNYAQLITACLEQGRAIGEVESAWAEKFLLWQFIPEPSLDTVMVRCRDATAEIRRKREAAVASRLYRLITENTTDLISRHTPDGRFLDASPASWILLGYWPEALRGRPAHSLLHPRDRGRSLFQAAEALARDGYLTLTYRIRHCDGHYLWFETACRGIRETYTGDVVEIVCISRDITARVRAEEENRRLAEVVRANTDLVLFIDSQWQLSMVNPAARRALGIRGDKDLPSLVDLLTPEDFQRLRQQGWSGAIQRGAWATEVRLLPLGSDNGFVVSLVLLAHKGAGGQYYFSLVARDMTERELREAEQRRHQDELAHTARLITMGELASGIAHEINQPLAAVMNYASASQRYLKALEERPENVARVAEGLRLIADQARHAAAVISRLRGFLRKGSRNIQPLAIDTVVREAMDLCAWEASRHQVTLQYVPDQAPRGLQPEGKLCESELPMVYGDAVLMEQVLVNLLRNAIEANWEQAPQQASRVVIRVAVEGDKLCLRVSDQGPGLPDEAREKLFTPFYTSKPDGLGLGLSMSRTIAEGFGGGLDVDASDGVGLTFCCWLPLRLRGENVPSRG